MRWQDPRVSRHRGSGAEPGRGSAWGLGGNADFHAPCLQGRPASAPALGALKRFLFPVCHMFCLLALNSVDHDRLLETLSPWLSCPLVCPSCPRPGFVFAHVRSLSCLTFLSRV